MKFIGEPLTEEEAKEIRSFYSNDGAEAWPIGKIAEHVNNSYKRFEQEGNENDLLVLLEGLKKTGSDSCA